MNTMLLILSVPRMISRSRSRSSDLRCSAISIAPIAPTPAASVGVANPPRIEPSTARIRISGGAIARNILPNETCSSSSATCAGSASGLMSAVITR